MDEEKILLEIKERRRINRAKSNSKNTNEIKQLQKEYEIQRRKVKKNYI